MSTTVADSGGSKSLFSYRLVHHLLRLAIDYDNAVLYSYRNKGV